MNFAKRVDLEMKVVPFSVMKQSIEGLTIQMNKETNFRRKNKLRLIKRDLLKAIKL